MYIDRLFDLDLGLIQEETKKARYQIRHEVGVING